MKLLLDTHTLLWLLGEPERIAPGVLRDIEDASHTIVISAVCAWEIATRHALVESPAPPLSTIGIRYVLQRVSGRRYPPLG